jgi:EpsI family protein
MNFRVVLLSLCLLLGAGVIAKASRTEIVPPRQSFASFPTMIGQWQGRDTARLTPEELAVLGDEYLSRVYFASPQSMAGLYIGYYESQRQGDSIHSPLNCLPGAGWQPLSKSYLAIPISDAGRTITVNRYVIEKGLERQVVLYWYQSHGRVVANEYRSKILMVYDAMRLNRSDAALVRVITGYMSSDGDQGEQEAHRRAVDFTKQMFPLLDKYLPS